MMTRKNQFYQEIRGRILHVTSFNGLRGILSYGAIRPNLDGSRGYGPWGEKDCYHCQTQNSVSVLDLKTAVETELFDPRGRQNWVGVFTIHSPGIVLVLDPESISPRLKRFRDPAQIYGKYIAEAEACHPGEIPMPAIEEAMVVEHRFRILRFQILFRSTDLNAVLALDPSSRVNAK